MKIYKRLGLGFLSIIFLLTMLGYMFVSTSRKNLREKLTHNYTLLGRSLLDKVDIAIYSRIEEIIIYTKGEKVQEEISLSNKRFSKIKGINQYINKTDIEWKELASEKTNPFIDSIADNHLSQSLREILEFYRARYGYSIFGEIFITNKYGVNIAQTGKTSDYKQSDEEWWKRAMTNGLYVSNVKYDKSSNLNSIAICVRIDNQKGKFIGILKAILNIKETESIIDNTIRQSISLTGAKESEMAFKLVNKNEEIIYSTEKYTIFEDLSEGLRAATRKWKIKKSAHNYIIGKGDKEGEEEKIFLFVDSKGYLSYKGLGWLLILENETNRILSPINNLLIIMLLVGIGVAILISLSISHSVSMPIIKLSHAMNEVGRGNLNIKLACDENSEIGILGVFFNRMVHDLKTLKEENKTKRWELETSEKTLRDKVDELESFAKLTVDREIKMIEIKKKAEVMEKELERYKKEAGEKEE